MKLRKREHHESDEQFTFHGDHCIEAFLDWAQTSMQTNNPDVRRKVICIAHNFKGYDSYFVLEQCYAKYLKLDQLANGTKILSLSFAGLKFLDSLSFLRMALSSFPKAFGLCELKNGFFSHFFNVKEHEHYIGPILTRDYYDPEGMSTTRKAEFEEWHAARVAEH